MENPPELQAILNGETPDFTVKSTRRFSKKRSLFLLGFGAIWLLFTSMFVVAFLGPLFSTGEMHFTENDEPKVATLSDIGPAVPIILFLSVFVIVGVAMFCGGLYMLLAKGGWFIGTPKRLISYRGKNIQSYDWEQFNGNIEVRGLGERGVIALQMRTGKMVSQKNGPSRYVPDSIEIVGIPEVLSISEKCRKRILQNDPTPPNDQLPPQGTIVN